MKKLLLLLITFSTILISCSSNDESSSNEDAIVGSWTLFKQTRNGVEDNLSDCDKQSSFVYSSDGTYTERIVRDGVSGGCRTINVRNGSWENTGNGFYTLVLDNNSAGSNTKYVFEGNTHYIEYTVSNTNYKVYYQK